MRRGEEFFRSMVMAGSGRAKQDAVYCGGSRYDASFKEDRRRFIMRERLKSRSNIYNYNNISMG